MRIVDETTNLDVDQPPTALLRWQNAELMAPIAGMTSDRPTVSDLAWTEPMSSPAASLRKRFDDLWFRAIGPDCTVRPWDRLDAGYGDAGRAYHGWPHVAAMLTGLDAAMSDPEFARVSRDEVELAVFFHDAVYEARRTDNEAASAALLIEEAGDQSLLGGEGLDRLRAMILATADHRPSDDAATRLLLDLDLAILGAAPAIYTGYAEAIRQEYAHVPEALWRIGRGAVLRRFLERERIFQSAFARPWEAAARANLAGELAGLEGRDR